MQGVLRLPSPSLLPSEVEPYPDKWGLEGLSENVGAPAIGGSIGAMLQC